MQPCTKTCSADSSCRNASLTYFLLLPRPSSQNEVGTAVYAYLWVIMKGTCTDCVAGDCAVYLLCEVSINGGFVGVFWGLGEGRVGSVI